MGSNQEVSHMEAIALAFCEKIEEKGLIKDRKYKLRNYPNVLVGQDAITVLVEVLKEMGYNKVTRPEALRLGREVNAQFRLLAHVADEQKHDLKDEYLFYRFKNNLPIQVHQARKGKSMWDIMDLFENGVDIQDRTYHFQTYPRCFIARDAVEVVLRMQLAVDREDAVELMLQANKECHAFEHVTRDHDFQDAYLFFRFIPLNQRPLNPGNGGQTYAALLDAMRPVSDSSHGSDLRASSTELSIDLMEDTPRPNGLNFLNRQQESFRSSARDSVASRLDYSTVLGLLPPNTTLQDIATQLEHEIPIKDHRYRFTVYKDCFVAREAVDHMVKSRIAPTRGRAEIIGRQLQSHLNLWEHVTGDHKFRDKYYFFRFTPVSERRQEPSLRPSTTSPANNSLPSVGDGTLPRIPSRTALGDRMPSNTVSLALELQDSKTSLSDIAKAFEEGMKLADRVYHLKTYKDAFIGSQAIKFLVKKGFADTRQDAVLLGRLLMEELFLFEHVGNVEKHLYDCPLTMYQMVPPEERKARTEVKQQREAEANSKLKTGSDELSSMIESLPLDSSEELSQEMDTQLLEIAALFKQGVKIKHNRYRGKIYPNTFIGCQAVDFLVNSSLASDRKEAVKLGRRLMNELLLFDHVSRKWNFADDYLFFRLEEHRTQSQGKHRASISKPSVSKTVGQTLHDSYSSLSNVGETIRKGFKDWSVVTPIQSGDFSGGTDFLPLEEIAREFRRNIEIKDRRYHFSTYKDVFVGSDAVDYLVGNTNWASSRREAVQVGRTLMRELNLFRHVTEAHPFQDDVFFYKFTDEDEETMIARLEALLSEADTPFVDNTGAMKPEWLTEVARTMEERLKPACHRHRLRVYNDTLLGSEIVSFLVDEGLATTRGEALQLGRAVAKHFRLIEHVTADHLLKDSNLFYRIVPRGSRSKGNWFDTTFGGALREKMSNAARKRTNLSTKEYWDLVAEAIEKDIWDIRSSLRHHTVRSFKIESEDSDWTNRVRSFEIQVSVRRAEALHDSTLSRRVSAVSTSDRVKSWSSTFIRLDPRQQIHRFYNEVAQTGLTLVEEDGSRGSVRAVTLKDLRPLFRFLPINLASVFSVWRPTSYDAIRKMMMGDAVGKGLDIKGKSAKRGKLSGYVPFLQISENKHKRKVRRLNPNQMVRVYYKEDARRARDIAIAELEKVLMEMIEMVKEAKKILASDRVDKDIHDNALDAMLLDVANPTITPIDDYAPECYGIELPERLFWEAYFVNQDCTRKEGSIYDTGRPSQPAFQDMNFSALRSNPPEGSPQPVIFQNADRDDPMNPFEMLMAYEENGRVRPVVSDFDCFLVGTRRVEYNMPLPPEQVEVLKWCVQQIETIVKAELTETRNGSVRDIKPWSVKWLEILKDSSFHPDIPRFGFGDPVSYSIVENAVDRLNLTGAVRHGAECFNYYFPQDLDDEFLVVSESSGDGNVPWKYVGVDKLLDILAAKIEEGFCFPLNPKWVLVDPGWMNLYQKLIASPHKHVQDAMNVWFPPETGLREDIHRIYRLQKECRKAFQNSDRVYEELSHSMKEEIMFFT